MLRLVVFEFGIGMLVPKSPNLALCCLACWLCTTGASQAQDGGFRLTMPTPSGIVTTKENRSWGTLQYLGPDTIADVASAVASAVVNIDVTTADSDSNRRNRDSGRHNRLAPPDNEARGTGTGVIIKSDGLILTSNHLLEGSSRIHVTLHDGRSYDGRLLGKDVFSDLAVVKIDAYDLPTVTFGNAAGLRPGDWVLAVGSPMGLDHTVTLGIISAIGREAKSFSSFGARSGAVRFIQTDAAINPGNSGGPLVNLKGEVIGINAFVRGSAQNIGFAIPADIAQDVADKLSRLHNISHPFIGIIMVPESLPGKSQETPLPGAMVQAVMPKSPAFMAGIMPGDLIIQIDHREIKRPDDVSDAVRRHDIGDHLWITIKREGHERLINVVVEQLPDETISERGEL